MKITQKMLNAAMKKAVTVKILPAHADETTYLKNWEGMKMVLEAALKSITDDTCPSCGKKLSYIEGWFTCHDCDNT